MICEWIKPEGTAIDLHHREIRMAFNHLFPHSQNRIPQKKLPSSFSAVWAQCKSAHNTHTTDQTLGIRIHQAIAREFEVVHEYTTIQKVVIVTQKGGCIEWLSDGIS